MPKRKYNCPYCQMAGRRVDQPALLLGYDYLFCPQCKAVGKCLNESHTLQCWAKSEALLEMLVDETEQRGRTVNSKSKRLDTRGNKGKRRTAELPYQTTEDGGCENQDTNPH